MRTPDACLVARVGARLLAIPAVAVTRVMPVRPLACPPSLPAPVIGFLDEGGVAVPVLSVARLLGQPEPAMLDLYAHIVRIEDAGAGPVCLLVDRVLDFRAVPDGELRQVAADASLNGCILAELTGADGAPIHLLAIERLLLEAEQVRLAELARAAAARLAQWEAA